MTLSKTRAELLGALHVMLVVGSLGCSSCGGITAEVPSSSTPTGPTSPESEETAPEETLPLVAPADFDGDGITDLFFAAPENGPRGTRPTYDDEEVPAGLIQVRLSRSGPVTLRPTAEEHDSFGHEIAIGDFNGDGFDDFFAAGDPLHVAYGADNGVFDILPHASLYAASGTKAAGDFNGDGFDDMVLGREAPDSLRNHTRESGLLIYYGSAAGLASEPAQSLIPPDMTWPESSDANSHSAFGRRRTWTADMNGDGYDDVLHRIYPTPARGPASDMFYRRDAIALYLGGPEGVSEHAIAVIEDPTSPPESEEEFIQMAHHRRDGSYWVVSSFAMLYEVWKNDHGPDRVLTGTVVEEEGVFRSAILEYRYVPSSRSFVSRVVAYPQGYFLLLARDVDGDGYDELVHSSRHSSAPGQLTVYWGSENGVSEDVDYVLPSAWQDLDEPTRTSLDTAEIYIDEEFVDAEGPGMFIRYWTSDTETGDAPAFQDYARLRRRDGHLVITSVERLDIPDSHD